MLGRQRISISQRRLALRQFKLGSVLAFYSPRFRFCCFVSRQSFLGPVGVLGRARVRLEVYLYLICINETQMLLESLLVSND